MSDYVLRTIEDAEAQLRATLNKASEQKKTINMLLKMLGQEPRYPESESDSMTTSILKGDEYLGKTQIIASREILERRKALNAGPATQSEIYDDLVAGGYKFETTDVSNRKRGLSQTLSKNTAIFYRLDNGKYGLLAWYPGVKAKKSAPESAVESSKASDSSRVQGVAQGTKDESEETAPHDEEEAGTQK